MSKHIKHILRNIGILVLIILAVFFLVKDQQGKEAAGRQRIQAAEQSSVQNGLTQKDLQKIYSALTEDEKEQLIELTGLTKDEIALAKQINEDPEVQKIISQIVSLPEAERKEAVRQLKQVLLSYTK